jgi:hypothetical protein
MRKYSDDTLDFIKLTPKSKSLKRPDFMDRERRKAEAAFQTDIQKALTDSLADFKKKILSNKSQKEYLPFADDIINDEEMWETFRVRVVGAAQPYFRNGALQAAAYNANLGLGVNMDWVNQAVLDFTRTYANDWWMELAKVTRDGLRKAIVAWQETGLGEQGLQDLVNSITPLFGEDRARRIAITETTKIFDEGNKLAHISAGIKYEQWQTAEDEFTCPVCSGLNEQYFPTESGPRPVVDTHPNCLLPDNEILISNLIAGSRAHYSGRAIEISTASGNRLSVTPNHPILTNSGFIKAKMLQEGDYVISGTDSKRIISAINPDNNQRPTRIEEIWNSLCLSSKMVTSHMPTTPIDFHGDAEFFNGNIDIVYSNSFLLNNIKNPFLFQHINKNKLGIRGMNKSSFQGDSPLFFFDNRGFAPPNGSMSSRASRLALLDRHMRHRHGISLASISRFNSGIYNGPMDHVSKNTVLLRQGKFRYPRDVFGNQSFRNRDAPINSNNIATIQQSVKGLGTYFKLANQITHAFAGLITLDKIVRIRDYNFNGHVYDLQSIEQFYISNNIIVKNCRCMREPAANYNPVE